VLGAHYLTYSIDNLFNFQRGSKSTYLLIDITKIMFTIEANAPQGGFFTDDALNQEPNLVYLKKADYGLRILASVEIKESLEVIANKLKLKVEAFVAGGNVDLDLMSRELNQEMTIKMFVVGGQSRDVVSAYSLSDLKSRAQRIESSMSYHTSQPIRYTIATTRDNWIVSYNTATDEFIKQTCTLPAVKASGAAVELNGLMLKGGPEGGDLRCCMARFGPWPTKATMPKYCRRARPKHPPGFAWRTSVDLDNQGNSIVPGSNVKFIFPPGTADGSYIDIYFAFLKKMPTPITLTGTETTTISPSATWTTPKRETGKTSRRLCYKRFYLNDLPKYDYREEFSEAGEVIELYPLEYFQIAHQSINHALHRIFKSVFLAAWRFICTSSTNPTIRRQSPMGQLGWWPWAKIPPQPCLRA